MSRDPGPRLFGEAELDEAFALRAWSACAPDRLGAGEPRAGLAVFELPLFDSRPASQGLWRVHVLAVALDADLAALARRPGAMRELARAAYGADAEELSWLGEPEIETRERRRALSLSPPPMEWSLLARNERAFAQALVGELAGPSSAWGRAWPLGLVFHVSRGPALPVEDGPEAAERLASAVASELGAVAGFDVSAGGQFALGNAGGIPPRLAAPDPGAWRAFAEARALGREIAPAPMGSGAGRL